MWGQYTHEHGTRKHTYMCPLEMLPLDAVVLLARVPITEHHESEAGEEMHIAKLFWLRGYDENLMKTRYLCGKNTRLCLHTRKNDWQLSGERDFNV